ncbi:hypothetical protein E2562_028068 [Oryza meyeriana var. granulata]|uniref:Uncharacterized protein n=1 Tax=Oryza meyeriana var. granulata TaxID=110450 RepID=A0A6G1C0Y8_9ORYZ|nr:hypothetical protein E2562_028068 [Oryza meyeriana var. granulata]
MAAAVLQQLLPNQAPASGTEALSNLLPIQQMASVNPALPAVGRPAGEAEATAPPPQPVGTPPMTGAAAGATLPPTDNWRIPVMAHGGAPFPAVAAASVTAGVKQQPNWSTGPGAASGAGGTKSAGVNQQPNWSTGPGALRPGESGGTKLWSLPSKILQVAKLPTLDGCIGRSDSVAIPPGTCTPMVVFLGPLFASMDLRLGMEQTKWTYVHNLISRARRKEHTEKKLMEYLSHINSMEPAIRQRYDPSECRITPEDLVEMMVLDGLFIIEVLIDHWLGKINKGSASPEVKTETVVIQQETPEKGDPDFRPPLASTMVPQALREDFTPLKVRWEPHALRYDLVVAPNQLPFFVLEELFKMTDVPELGESQKQPAKLREIVLDYLVGGVGDDGFLAGYRGPVYHILHLVYLHLTFSKEEIRVSALQPEKPVPRPSLLDRALDKLKKKRMDLRASCKRTFSRSSNLPVGWKEWKQIPPLRELVRVGVKLKRGETYRFAEVKFKNGKLEIPAVAWRPYHIRLLTNLVVLEMSGWWPREKRLFCSYVMFMAELLMKKEDAALLFNKGIVQGNNISGDFEKSLICPILMLADVSHGSRYERRFSDLVDRMVNCYQRWAKVGVAPRTTKQVN